MKTISIRNEQQANVQRMTRAIARVALGRVSLAREEAKAVSSDVDKLRSELAHAGYDPNTRTFKQKPNTMQEQIIEAEEALKMLDSETRESKNEE